MCERPQDFLENATSFSVGEKVFPARDKAPPQTVGSSTRITVFITPGAIEIVPQDLPVLTPEV